MGVWGTGNFDNDVASDFLDSIILSLHDNIQVCFNAHYQGNFSLDEHGDGKLMPSLDLLITVCNKYQCSPLLEISKIHQWQNEYLQIYDGIIDDYGAKEEYKINRRKVIMTTFSELATLAHEFPL